jgi:large subunit ribosomal protein L7/L12
LEVTFDVKAVAAAAPAAAATAGESAPAAEEKTEFEVVMTSGGTNKIAVIKAIREFKPELGLKEAKDLVDAAPANLGTMKKEAAAEAKSKMEAAGAQVELK